MLQLTGILNILLFLFVGTFLFDCEMQREQSKLRNKTTSLWSYLNDELVLVQYRNPLFERNIDILWPSIAPQSFVSILCNFVIF